MQRITSAAILVVLALLIGMTACGSDDNKASSGPCTTITSDTYTLVAKNLRWNTDCLQIKAGQQVTINVENTEAVEHNLHILGTGQDLETPLQPGPGVNRLVVKIDQRGSYTYTCDIHKATMTGTLRVT